MPAKRLHGGKEAIAVSVAGTYRSEDIILYTAFVHLRSSVSCRNPEEIMAKRGVTVRHSPLNRRMEHYTGLVSELTFQRDLPFPRRSQGTRLLLAVRMALKRS